VEEGDVPFEVLLGLLEDPLLEVNEIEGVRVVNLTGLQPLDIKREVIGNFLPVEDPVDHVATKKPHLYLIPRVRVDLVVLVNRLEYVAGRRPVAEFEVIESPLVYSLSVPLLKIFDWHVFQHNRQLAVGILEHYMGLHVLLIHLAHKLLELWRFHTLLPFFGIYVCFSQRIRHLSVAEVLQNRISEKYVSFKEIELGSQPFSVSQIRGIVVEQLLSTFLQVLNLTYLKVYLLKLSLQVLALLADSLLPQEVGPRFVLRLHFAVSSVLESVRFVLEVLFVLFELIVEDDIFFELVFIVAEKGVFDDVREGHSFFTVHHEYSLEKILQFHL